MSSVSQYDWRLDLPFVMTREDSNVAAADRAQNLSRCHASSKCKIEMYQLTSRLISTGLTDIE